MVWLVSRLLGRGAAPRSGGAVRFSPRLEVLTDRTVPSANPLWGGGEVVDPGEEIPTAWGGYEVMGRKGTTDEIPQGQDVGYEVMVGKGATEELPQSW